MLFKANNYLLLRISESRKGVEAINAGLVTEVPNLSLFLGRHGH